MATTPRNTGKAAAAGAAATKAPAPAEEQAVETAAKVIDFAATLRELKKNIDPSLVRQREGWRDRNGNVNMVDYVEWHTVADILDETAPGWSFAVKDLRVIGDLMVCTAAITIDGVTREGVGTGMAGTEMGIKKAEHDALKRAGVKFGIARELYHKESSAIEQGGGYDQTQQGGYSGGGGGYSGGGYSGQQGGGQQWQLGMPVQFPANPISRSLSELVTAKQLGMIRAIARECRINPDEECMAVMNCNTDELTKRAGSALINHLQNIQAGHVFPTGEDNERDFSYNPDAGQQTHTGGAPPQRAGGAPPAGVLMVGMPRVNALRILCHNLSLSEADVASDASGGRATELNKLTAEEAEELHGTLSTM